MIEEIIKDVSSQTTAYVSTLALIVSILSLIFAHRTYVVYAKRQALNKQIELVFKLAEDIQKEAMEIQYNHTHPDGTISISRIGPFTLFGITISFLGSLSKPVKRDYDKPIFFDSTRISDILSNYVYNPLLPSSIAEQVENIMMKNIGAVSDFSYVKDQKNFVYVIHNKEYTEQEITDIQKNSYLHVTPRYETPGYDSYKDFLICNNNLKKSITKWLKANGINDINIRYR